MATRKRCSECRKTFTASPKAASSQRICGPECRLARNNKLQRARRRRDVEAHRADERQRQHDSRAQRRGDVTCHAQPSAAKPSDSLKEIELLVDRALALSRATLVRELLKKLPLPRKTLAPVAAVTRNHEPLTIENDAGFRKDPGTCHT